MAKHEPSENLDEPETIVVFPVGKKLPRLPPIGELKKAVQAVHIVPRKGKVTLLMRKTFNVLLHNAVQHYRRGHDVDVFEMGWSELIDALVFNSKNTAVLKATLKELRACEVEWNYLGDKTKAEWGITGLVAWVQVSQGRLRYGFGETSYKELLNPEIYAHIDLSLQQEFKSMYSLALYENCIRYAKLGRTARLATEQWRLLICGPESDSYKEFKDFNRYAIKKAVEEINGLPQCRISLTTLYFYSGRTVTELQFEVTARAQHSLELDSTIPAIDPALEEKLRQYGFDDRKIADLLVTYEQDYILANLEYVGSRIAKSKPGEIRNAKAYIESALKRDFRTTEQKTKALTEEKEKAVKTESALEKLERAFDEFRRVRVWEKYEQLPPKTRTEVLSEFKAMNMPTIIKSRLDKHGLDHKIVKAEFVTWLIKRPDFLTDRIEIDKLYFAAERGLLT